MQTRGTASTPFTIAITRVGEYVCFVLILFIRILRHQIMCSRVFRLILLRCRLHRTPLKWNVIAPATDWGYIRPPVEVRNNIRRESNSVTIYP